MHILAAELFLEFLEDSLLGLDLLLAHLLELVADCQVIFDHLLVLFSD